MRTMFFKQQILTKNDCYKANRQIQIKGLMLHSTGANNPYISRYVQPDDGLLGKNKHNNHWNQSGISKCVHAFIGLDTNGDVQTYQTLPWAHRAWHAGGKANDTHISVEICEGDLGNKIYFNKVYNAAVKLFAHLCNFYKLTEKDIIDHAEGRKLGIASNHGDVGHWFPKHGKSMDTFRADVKKLLISTPDKPSTSTATSNPKTISKLADETMKGLHGSGRDRMVSLGSNYDAVQKEINRRLRA